MGLMKHVAISVTMLLGIFTAASAETLKIRGDSEYVPVIYLRAGQPAGLLPAILKRAEAITGDHYEIELSPWKRAYDLAARGEGGVIGVSYTEERSKLFDFSKSVYDDDIQLVMLKERSFAFAKLDDLKGKVVGGVSGASYGDKVDKQIAAGLFTVERDVSQIGRLRKLLAGRLNAALIGNGQAGFESVINAHEELRANRDRFVIAPVPVNRDPLHLAFAKSMGKRAAIDRFDAAIEQLRKSGELKTLAAEAVK